MEVSADRYVAELQTYMRKAHEVARKHITTSQERMKRDYDLKTITQVYEVSDLVCILDTVTIKGQNKCLKTWETSRKKKKRTTKTIFSGQKPIFCQVFMFRKPAK